METKLQQFFDLLHENSVKEFRFYKSAQGMEFISSLKNIANQIQHEDWKRYALNVVEALKKAIENEDAEQMNAIVLNVFQNQMTLIWS